MQADCPKCKSDSAWYRRDGPDLVLRCLCGFHKVVATTLGKIEIHTSLSGQEVRLPKRESNLWFTLVVLAALEAASSAEIKERLDDLGLAFSTSDVASYLTILRTKGLVRTTEVRRGMIGGSTWQLSARCAALLGTDQGMEA